jgi:hypothetical protein
MPHIRRFLYPLAIAASAFAVVGLAISPASARTTRTASSPISLPTGAHVIQVSGLPAGIHLVKSPTPPPAAPIRPLTEEEGCNDGNLTWVQIEGPGPSKCFGDKGTLPANYEDATILCSGNNTGSAQVSIEDEVPTTLSFSPTDYYSPGYYWYEESDGAPAWFYVNSIDIGYWDGDAEC